LFGKVLAHVHRIEWQVTLIEFLWYPLTLLFQNVIAHCWAGQRFTSCSYFDHIGQQNFVCTSNWRHHFRWSAQSVNTTGSVRHRDQAYDTQTVRWQPSCVV
jgi:hypothetical protein